MKNLAMLTDFYELTMMQGYYFLCPEERGAFEMFFRRQPFGGGYSIFAGLAPFLRALENINFTDEDLYFLESQGIFKEEFLQFLRSFKFRGDVYSVKEGTVVFPNEPLIRVEGTLMECQLIESMLLNHVNFQTMVATKTCRIVEAAENQPVLEFGLRRAHGVDGAISAARAAFIGGVSATSNTLAGKILDMPVKGTMAHSWVMGFPSEEESFKAYVDIYPNRPVLLVDTYDTLKSGIPNAVNVFKQLKKKSHPEFMAVRLDSGDLEYLSKEARKILDGNGLQEVKIVVSSDLDEWIVEHLKRSGAPIDLWGVGTRLVTGKGDPFLTGVFKIVAKDEGNGFTPCIKISNQPEKITNPGRKNVLRFYNKNGLAIADMLYLESEKSEILSAADTGSPFTLFHPTSDVAHIKIDSYEKASPLLSKVIAKGKVCVVSPTIEDIRQHRSEEISTLDPTFKRLLNPHIYKVSLSRGLKNLKRRMTEKFFF